MSSAPCRPTLLSVAALVVLASGLLTALAQEPQPEPARPDPRQIVVEPPAMPDMPVIAFPGDDERPLVLSQYLMARSRSYLGVQVVDLTPELCRHFGLSGKGAVMVGSVSEDSPAQKAGIAVGDIIAAVDNKTIGGSWDLRKKITAHDDGEIIQLTVWRNSKKRTIQATVEERDVERIHLEDLDRLKTRDFRGLKNLHLPQTPKLPRLTGISEHTLDEYKEALESLREALNNQEFIKQLRTVEERREKELEKKLREVDKRLKELEKRLKSRSAKRNSKHRG